MPLNKATKYKRVDVNKFLKEQRLATEENIRIILVPSKIELSTTQRKSRRLDEKVRLVSICRIILLKAWELYILYVEFEGSREGSILYFIYLL